MTIVRYDRPPSTDVATLVRMVRNVQDDLAHKQPVESAQSVTGVSVTANETLTVTDSMTLSSPVAAPGPTLTIPQTGTAALLEAANAFTTAQSITFTDAGTTNQPNVATFIHGTSGTPGVGFGLSFALQAHSSTNTIRNLAAFLPFWVTATDASRKARFSLYVYDTAAREAIRMEASGTAAMLGFFGVAAVVRPTALTAANAGAINSGDATTDAVIANMRTRINELETKLQALGLLT